MIRNLKLLGLVLGVVFAFAAISASSAMAETEMKGKFTAGASPFTVTGTQEGANHKFVFLGGAATLTCTSSHFDGVGENTSPATSVTVTPTYTGCNTSYTAPKVDPENPTTVTHNGCTYTLTVHEEIEKDTWNGELHLLCPEGVKGIEVHVYDDATKHAENKPKCTFLVEPQTVKGLLYHVNTVTHDVTITAPGVGVVTKKISGALTECGAGSFTAEYTGNVTVDTFNKAGEPVSGGIE